MIGVCVILGGCGKSVDLDIPDDAIAISDSNENDDFIDDLGYEIWN
jgi:hypothetical protein